MTNGGICTIKAFNQHFLNKKGATLVESELDFRRRLDA
jgi:hypothetical protein